MKDNAKDSDQDHKKSHYQGHGRGERSGRSSDPRRSLSDLSIEELRHYFLACSCCGHFLASYRIIHGREALEDAGRAVADGWVPLAWDLPTRNLLRDIYGLRTDVESFHLEAMCPECRRRIVFTADQEPDPVLPPEVGDDLPSEGDPKSDKGDSISDGVDPISDEGDPTPDQEADQRPPALVFRMTVA